MPQVKYIVEEGSSNRPPCFDELINAIQHLGKRMKYTRQQKTMLREESERVDECDTAKKVWDTLQTHHEGTCHVKEIRIDIGVQKFELLEMNEGETIDEMYSRFTTIVNEMRSLRKAYSIQDKLRKALRCLSII
ncbi:uncharacterized protein [Cicer arietinum]|uniref:uncharacterized protein n=1 Tax=Cicer arietinum TaxID=3827 RepID=UPI003CC689CB